MQQQQQPSSSSSGIPRGLRAAANLLRQFGISGQCALLLMPALLALLLAAVREWQRGGASWAFWIELGAFALACYLGLAFRWQLRAALGQLSAAARAMREGDLTGRMAMPGRDELAEAARTMDEVGTTLSSLVAGVRSDAVVVALAGRSLSAAASDLASRTERQAATLEQTSASVQALAETVRENAHEAVSVGELAARVRGIADAGGQRMTDAVGAVRQIQDSASRMREITGVIEGIAFQTNILALNAAVEAARAGEAGRGFAVVASEVRALALRSSQAAQEVRGLLETSGTQVEAGVRHIDGVSGMLGQIVQGVARVATQLETISRAATTQSTAVAELSQAVSGLDEITQQNAHMVERSSADSAELGERAGRLAGTVRAFRLRQGTADEAYALVEKAQARWQAAGRAALKEFTDASRGYCDRDMYVFAWDRELVYHAFAGKPANVGKTAREIIGTDVTRLREDVWRAAAAGGGWVDYEFRNPVTGEVAPKTSYVVPAGEDLLLGCGIYKPVRAD